MISEIRKDNRTNNKIVPYMLENMQQSSIIFITDAECRILSANEKFVNMAGYTLFEDIKDKTVEEIFNIEKSVIRSAIETKEHILKTNKKRFKDSNGIPQHFLIYAIPISNGERTILGGIEIMISIHDRFRQEELTNLTAINMPHHLKYIFINSKKTYEGSQYSNFDFSQFSFLEGAEEVIEKGIRKLLDIKDNDHQFDIKGINSKSISVSKKEYLEDLNDSHIQAVISYTQSSNGDDESKAIIKYVSDGYITEVMDMADLKKELQKSEIEYKSLLESMDIPIFILNRDCEYLFINDCYLLNFEGFSKNDIIGAHYSEFHDKIRSRNMIDRIEEVFLTKRTMQYEYQDDSNSQWYLRTISPFIDEEGKLTAVTIFSKDITELKKVKNSLMQKTKKSENFAHMIMHDFKTPLVTIRGFASMLREKFESYDNTELIEYVSYIEDNAKKIDDLMEDMIAYSQIEYISYPDEQVPFKYIVDESIIQLKSMIALNNILVRIEPGLPMVCVDRRRLVEVITNIIENSIVHNVGRSDIIIDIGCRNDSGKQVFFVKDNGKGIDKKFHDKIFDMFYKLDASSDGTGSGLAIVRKIIESHGGKVWVESDSEIDGCTICFTLF